MPLKMISAPQPAVQRNTGYKKSTIHFHEGHYFFVKEVVSEDLSEAYREVENLKTIPQHPNLANLIYFDTLEDRARLVFFGGSKSLLNFINENAGLAEPVARRIFVGLLEVVGHIHSYGAIHTNIKSETILIQSDITPILTSMEYIRFFEPTRPILQSFGSLHYASPEMFREVPVKGPEVDTWALGVTLYAMTVGYLPWRGQGSEVARQICSGNIYLPSHLSEDLTTFIKKILNINYSERIKNIHDLKSDRWVTEKSD